MRVEYTDCIILANALEELIYVTAVTKGYTERSAEAKKNFALALQTLIMNIK